MKPRSIKIDDLSIDPANARKHSQKNLDAIVASLRRFGQQKPIVIDKSNIVRAGNGTLEAARQLGWETILAVQTSLTGSEATAYAIADNRTAELAEWDDDILKATLESLADEDAALLESCGYTEAELDALVNEVEGDGEGGDQGSGESQYTNKITAPIYEPKGERPPIRDLSDKTKTNELCSEIEKAELPEDVRNFLLTAAQRHTVFNFRNIAEFYCHASADVQHLMERSGLIIIDMDKAIANGFVHLSERLGVIADLELSEGEDA
jgi:hypothetical protein